MIKGIIFDLDGTLLDTVMDIKTHLNRTLELHNYNILTDEEVKEFLGNGSKALVKKAIKEEVSEETLNEITKTYLSLYNTKGANVYTKPYDGVFELLEGLNKINIKTAITSNKMQEGVTDLNNTVFNNKIDIALGESKDIPLKPNPTMLYKALELLSLKKDEVLFIGDTEVDLLAASNASINSVAVTWGFRTKEFLLKENANYIIDSPLELIDIINNINKG